jgi:three-Cys-motif partner protein
MADPKETVYAADPHTKAKHQILEGYLKRWFTILGKQANKIGSSRRLLYVDGFAGAGEYENSVPGSPLVAIRAAIGSADPAIPIRIHLIEKRPDRAQHLTRLLACTNSGLSAAKVQIDPPIQGDCETEIGKLIDAEEAAKHKLGPAFFFLDQFGYSSFSMSLLRRILAYPTCEVFSYLNWNLLHPFMSDPTKAAGITKAFGGDEWRDVVGRSGADKEDAFREIYIAALKSRGGAEFIYPFAMRDATNRVIYWLFFSTNKLRGLEEMKRAMWDVDRSGSFEFSDKFASSMGQLFQYSPADLARDVHATFAGRDLTVEEIQRFVLTSTPAVKFKTSLEMLQRDGKLRPKSTQIRKFDFSDPKLVLHFIKDPVPASLFGGF